MSKIDSVLASEGHRNPSWGEGELFTCTAEVTPCMNYQDALYYTLFPAHHYLYELLNDIDTITK